LNDYSNAVTRAQVRASLCKRGIQLIDDPQTLDSKISSDANKISSNYAALVALSVRQA
jgi:hypothetical protein